MTEGPQAERSERRGRPVLRYALWAAVALLILAALWPRGLKVLPADESPPASELLLRSLDGRVYDLASLRGQVVLINLWASWCGPCREEIPWLSRLHERHGADGLVVIGVNVEERPAREVGILGERLGVRYPTALPAAPLRGTFAGSGVLPQTWLVDAEGRVRASHGGLVPEAALAAACRELLDERAGR